MSEGNNMMRVKFDGFTKSFLVSNSTGLTGKIISFQDGSTQRFPYSKVSKSAWVAFPSWMFGAGFKVCRFRIRRFCFAFVPSFVSFLGISPSLFKLRVVFQSSINLTPIIVRFVSRLKAHASQCWTLFFRQTFVPCWSRETLPASPIMPENIFGYLFASTSLPIEGFWKIESTTAFARCHAIHYSNKIADTQQQSDKLLGSPYLRVISSQAWGMA